MRFKKLLFCAMYTTVVLGATPHMHGMKSRTKKNEETRKKTDRITLSEFLVEWFKILKENEREKKLKKHYSIF